MRSYFSRLRTVNISTLVPLCAALLVALLAAGCSADVDGSLGYDMVPNNQKLVMRHLSFRGDKIVRFNEQTGQNDHIAAPAPLFATTQYLTDSILSSNMGSGYFGLQRNDITGTRKASFASSIIYMNAVDATEGFGYLPIFDTVKMLITVKNYAGDTLLPIKYNVYALKSKLLGSVMKEKDSTAYTNCDLSPLYDADKPIFTFTFPKDKTEGPATEIINLDPVRQPGSERLSAQTWDFVRRLMLIPENYDAPDSDWDKYGRSGIEIYQDETKWMEAFPGVYIVPDESSVDASKGGAMYAIDLGSSGLFLQGRNRNPEDPSLIKDTVGMYYYFKDTYTTNNFSVNKVEHDLTKGLTQTPVLANTKMDAEIDYSERDKVSVCYVEGMAGPVMELCFTDAFIDELLDISEGYTEAGVNQCLLSLYLEGADYDWTVTQGNAESLLDLLDMSPERLGLYVNYKRFSPVPDYDFIYETTYDTESSFDGYIYRSRACYRMNITSYMQRLYNYASTLTRKEDGSYDFEEKRAGNQLYTPRTIYVGPQATAPFMFDHTKLQGADDGNGGQTGKAPIHVDLTYTLIK